MIEKYLNISTSSILLLQNLLNISRQKGKIGMWFICGRWPFDFALNYCLIFSYNEIVSSNKIALQKLLRLSEAKIRHLE